MEVVVVVVVEVAVVDTEGEVVVENGGRLAFC